MASSKGKSRGPRVMGIAIEYHDLRTGDVGNRGFYHGKPTQFSYTIPKSSPSGWWFGTFGLFFHILGIIIPTDEVIFFRGVGLNH